KKRDSPPNALYRTFYRQCYPPPTPSTSSRRICHLKRDILQPQPIPQSNPSIPPAVLPPPIMNFLGASLEMSTDVIDDFWDILQDYVWKIPVFPLTSMDFQLCKQFGWPCGLI
ncbi:hypothetical protein K443DRAFT_84167, partial [Laccaria amethystina LaAM-08-1]